MNRTLVLEKELIKLRYAKSIPKCDLQLKERLSKEGWAQLKEPASLLLASLISIPIMVLNGLVFLLLIYLLKPSVINFGEIQPSIMITINLQSILYLLGAVLFFALHELIHVFLFQTGGTLIRRFSGSALWGYLSTPLNKSRKKPSSLFQ